ncbi:hypothetical protein HMH01_14135 [Halovulum dunhuangense]|uniref:Uncharacterized protein n=1 Tax=Halovulum dunhuangense TaxID=1505036 RepID=A0A849L5B8_9RHOB|nr:hypothetical protein [Halovulum dunhuangense]NNU81575.1 hypothetical protein [Halovulum dunhuangense]
MVESLFTLLLAGCADDGSFCTLLERRTLAVHDVAACEAMLDLRLSDLTAEYPVFVGICLSGSEAAAPAGWNLDRPEALPKDISA